MTTNHAFQVTQDHILFLEELNSEDIGLWANCDAAGYSVYQTEEEAINHTRLELHKPKPSHPLRRRTDKLFLDADEQAEIAAMGIIGVL